MLIWSRDLPMMVRGPWWGPYDGFLTLHVVGDLIIYSDFLNLKTLYGLRWPLFGLQIVILRF